jgi:uncharacterized protein YyaL (SSP411 family)
MDKQRKRNRLVLEKSPYLLQHADNPVDWYPWGDEAFEKAARENKLIFLSIGYSTCHWCHVMAHESFEDPEVARLMNAVFVSIKVDREERPDIDMLYMNVCQMMTGGGGWPLTIIMTPDREPFFAGTYIPRETRYGRPGLLELIPRIREIWATRKNEVLDSARQIIAALREAAQSVPGEDLDTDTLRLAYEQLRERFDKDHGGFGGAPKFPTAHNLTFLLRYWKRTGEGEALEMVEKTLQAMRRGGVYDQVGFGFHRYATDRRWLVPHFEKMLYDQALLAAVYIEAFQATGKEEYAETARELYAYVLRDMTDKGGGFYSAEDADSEGEEGKFYLWTPGEIKEALAPEEADLVIKVFNITEGGNFLEDATEAEIGRSILHLSHPISEAAAGSNMSLPELGRRLEMAREKLFAYRQKRIHPLKDDKVLTDWNGLMIAALAKGSRALDEPEYARAAANAIEFIFDKMLDSNGQLLHRYREGEAVVPGHLDDYAFLIHGLIELYETTFEVDYLKKALVLNGYLLDHFWDDKNGGFYFTADDGEGLLIRQKEIYDGAIPSGNSIAMLNLLRLAGLTADLHLEEKAVVLGRAFVENVRQMPSAYTQLMVAVDFAVGPSFEVVIAGDRRAKETREMLQAAHNRFIPNGVIIFVPPPPEASEIKRIAPFTADHNMLEGKATAYVCMNHECKLPVTDTAGMLARLGSP